MGYKMCFHEKKMDNYPCYFFSSGALVALYKTGSVYLNGEIRRKHQARPWIPSTEVGEVGEWGESL